MNGTGLWHFNISWYVGLSRGWIISPQPVLLLFFLGGRFVTVQCQLHHHRAERIPSNFAPPFGHGMLVKPQQLNNYFSRPSSFIRRSCSPSGRWTLSARTPAAVCAAKQGSCSQDGGSFRFQWRGAACPVSCETPVPLSFLQLTYSQEICHHSGENILDCFSCVLWFLIFKSSGWEREVQISGWKVQPHWGLLV